MIKVLGLLLLMAACAGIGLAESHKLTARAEFLEDFRRFLTASQAEIQYGLVPVRELVLSFQDEMPLFKTCANRILAGESFPRAWKQAVQEQGGEDRGFLLEFGKGLGTTGLEGQMAHVRLYQELTDARLMQARKNCEKKESCTGSLDFWEVLPLPLCCW